MATQTNPVASASIPVAQTSPSNSGNQSAPVPFRMATRERSEIDYTWTGSLTASQQFVSWPVGGTGFLYAMMLRMSAIAAGNAATVAYQEDAPYSSMAEVSIGDAGAPFFDLSGYNAYLATLADANYGGTWIDKSALSSLTTGAGATGGSFQAFLRVPAGLNRRTLLGVLGNQDRAQKYQLRTDVAPSTSIYSTAPTTLPSFEVDRMNENYSAPPPVGPSGPNSIVPMGFSTFSFHTQMLTETPPTPGMVNHLISRVGNTARYFILVFRQNGSRANAEASMSGGNPAVGAAQISVRFGDTVQFTEPWWYRKARMYEGYQQDFPNGVLLYDTLHDFSPHAGNELGNDWWDLENISRAQFMITYPNAIGSTNNSLYIVTSDMALVGKPLAA